jgi:hypothetical protein
VNISPCPFCGDDDPIHDEISPDVYAVICGTCGRIGPCYHGESAEGVSAEMETLVTNTSVEQAVTAWNSRGTA